MPHIHLETTSDLPENADIPDILEALVCELCKHDNVRSDSVKAYHSMRSNWVVGNGHPDGIAHCTVSILTGRPAELRQAISKAMAATLKKCFAESLDNGEVGLTLELREMDATTYQRIHVQEI
jgi:5-carboxymethyl-2-hydroxymuconate isomerase